MVRFILNKWDFKIIERELIELGFAPLVDFDLSWTEEEPRGWAIEFFNHEAALLWQLQHSHKWI